MLLPPPLFQIFNTPLLFLFLLIISIQFATSPTPPIFLTIFSQPSHSFQLSPQIFYPYPITFVFPPHSPLDDEIFHFNSFLINSIPFITRFKRARNMLVPYLLLLFFQNSRRFVFPLITIHKQKILCFSAFLADSDRKSQHLQCLRVKYENRIQIFTLNLLFYIIQMKKLSSWTDQEDKLLLEFYNQADCFQKWKYISEKLCQKGFLKNQIECRQRFVNKLNPDLRHDRLSKSEVQSLFQYYDQYGPLWSVFESLIPGRSQNLLKNKFYSTLRSLVRILFTSIDADSEQAQCVCSAALSSKLLVQIYKGKKNFRKYKGFLSSMLHKLNFQLDVEKSCFIKTQLNLKTIKNLREEISNSIQSKSQTKRKTGRVTTENCGSKQKNKKELKLVKGSQYLHEQTKEKGSQVKESPGAESKVEQSAFGVYLAPMSPFNFFVPCWGYTILQQTKLQQKDL